MILGDLKMDVGSEGGGGDDGGAELVVGFLAVNGRTSDSVQCSIITIVYHAQIVHIFHSFQRRSVQKRVDSGQRIF